MAVTSPPPTNCDTARPSLRAARRDAGGLASLRNGQAAGHCDLTRIARKRLFFASQRRVSGNRKVENTMNYSNREPCTDSLRASLLRSRDWRRRLKAKFPDDKRISRAAETLDRIAGETDNLTQEEWDSLSRHYDCSSGVWAESVSQAARDVEFRYDVRTFHGFINNLIGILSEQNVATN